MAALAILAGAGAVGQDDAAPAPCVVIAVLALAFACIRILREYERAVVFGPGKYQSAEGPGIIIVVPGIQQTGRVDLRTVIHAEDEFEAPRQVAESARARSADPRAIQRRHLQPRVNIGLENHTTIVFPLPLAVIAALLPKPTEAADRS